MEKTILGFHIYKIWQILNHYSRQLFWSHISNFWRVCTSVLTTTMCTTHKRMERWDICLSSVSLFFSVSLLLFRSSYISVIIPSVFIPVFSVPFLRSIPMFCQKQIWHCHYQFRLCPQIRAVQFQRWASTNHGCWRRTSFWNFLCCS